MSRRKQPSPYDAHHRKIRALVLAEAGHKCYWCGGTATEADHVIALADGGTNVINNYVAACKTCNRRRGQRTMQAKRESRSFSTSRPW